MSYIFVPAGYKRGVSFAAASLLLALAIVVSAAPAEASGHYSGYSYPYDTYNYGYGDGYYGSNYGYGYYDDYYYDGSYDYNYGYGGYNNDYYYGDHRYGYGRRPTCSMTLTYGTGASTYRSYLHAPATLTWTTRNASSGYISPDVGSVGTSGSRVVYPYGNQSYTMTVYGPGGSNTCQVTAVSPYVSDYFNRYPYAYNTGYYNYNYPYNYGGYYAYPGTYTYPTYYYPATSYVALDKVPYTGDGFGFAGTLLAWLAVVLAGSLAAAFLAVRARFPQKIAARIRR